MNTGAMDDEHAIVRVEVRYRLRGFDRGEVARTRYLALAPRGGTWTIAGRRDVPRADRRRRHLGRGPARRRPGPGRPRHRRRRPGLRGIAARLDAAVPDVTGVVGAGWARRVVALAPADPGLASALAGPGQSLGQIAALATVAPAPSSGGRGEDRIVVSPTAFGRLNDLGRTVVLTHELTHVATGGARDRRTPLWLIEGFADYVGYRHVEIGARAAARRAAPRGRGRAGARRPARDRRLRRRLPAPLPGLPGGLARLPDGRRPVR
ncbi:basic secretory family protein [Actinomadura madurae]|uniref:basic secretory family protein n=1 Tax=Actinomadura madurae TaxID=1993 RepID=UPI0020D20A5C|nr:basic secretory family protein [Actinomadura madurae]MCP9984043.1 basic secretory family protein [Actinomadura madurae]